MWNDLLVRLLRLLFRRWGTWPAGVDAEEIGTLPMFSGDADSSERSNSVPWSHRSLTFRSYFGKFNRTTAWMLETSVDDPIVTDNTVMTRAEKRFSALAHYVLVLTCRSKALQVIQTSSQRFSDRDMEAAVRGVRVTSSSKVARNVSSPLVVDEVR